MSHLYWYCTIFFLTDHVINIFTFITSGLSHHLWLLRVLDRKYKVMACSQSWTYEVVIMVSVTYGLDTPYLLFWNSPHPRHPLIRPISPISLISLYGQTKHRCSTDIRRAFVVSFIQKKVRLQQAWLVSPSPSRSSRETPAIIQYSSDPFPPGHGNSYSAKKKILFSNSKPVHGQLIPGMVLPFWLMMCWADAVASVPT